MQIPQIVSAVDFDMQNPEHLRAFEEEMTEMMSGAIKRQQRVQRVHDVTTKAKLTGRELELAMQGSPDSLGGADMDDLDALIENLDLGLGEIARVDRRLL